MDILLIDPPYIGLKGMPIDCGYHVGLTSLAAYLRDEGIETAVLMGDLLLDLPSGNKWLSSNLKKYAAGQRDYETIIDDKTHTVWGKIADRVRQAEPLAVGISYLTPLKCVVARIASLVKEIDRDIKVIVGSFHPTACPEEVMRNTDIDFAVVGEGEIPLRRLVKELKKDRPKWANVPGIHYRDNEGQVQHNPAASLISDLDELPFPARDLVLNCDYNHYRVHSLATGRGCPYTCSFCADRKLWGGKVRRRSVANVMAELRLLKDTYKPNCIDITDGTFTYDREYLRTFCNIMIDHELKIKWRCTARYDNLDEGLLQLMKRANCSGLYFGLESGSDRLLKAVSKNLTVAKIREVSQMVHDSGIPSVTSVLLGLPDEGREDMAATLQLMKAIKTDIFDVNSYVPLPGTPLYEAMSEEDRKNLDWRKVAFKSLDNYFSKRMSYEDFRIYRAEAYQIANAVRRKTAVRFAVRMFFDSIGGLFRKLRR